MIGTLGYYFGLEMDFKFNETSQGVFSYPKRSNGRRVPFYDSIECGKLVQMDPYGVYIITEVEETGNGTRKCKEVTVKSLEYELADKRVLFAEGVYNFWNPADAENTVLGAALSAAMNWGIGEVSHTLIGRYRTFPETDGKLLSFLIDTIQETYGCVFLFDTYHRTINVLDADADVPVVPVYLSNQNLIEEDVLTERTESMFTKLLVKGADGVDIRNVNPTGDGYLYNIDHYISNGDIPDDLASKWRTWQNTIFARQPYYTSLVALRNSAMSRYLAESANLTDMQNSLSTLNHKMATFEDMLRKEDLQEFNRTYFEEQSKDAGIEAGRLRSEIKNQEELIGDIKAEYAGYTEEIEAVNRELNIRYFFESNELSILDFYFKEDVYQDSTFAVFNVDASDAGGFSSLDRVSVQFSDVTWTDVPCDGGHSMAAISGGRVDVSGEGVSISANIISGTVDHESDNFVCSLYLGSGSDNGTSFPSGNLTCAGRSVYSDSVLLDSMTKHERALSSDDGSVTHTVYYYAGSPSIVLDKGGTDRNCTVYFTRNVTEYQRYSVEQELYDWASSCIRDIASPTYTFEISCGNILYEKHFKPFRDVIQLGCAVHLQLDDDKLVKPVLLEMHVNFEEPDDFSLVFSNEFKRSDKVQTMKDILANAQAASNTIDMSKYNFMENKQATTWVSNLLMNGYNAALQRIYAGQEQCVTIDKAGIVIDSYVETVEGPGGTQSTRAVDKIMLTNGMIALVERDESGNETVRMAMGHFYDENLRHDFVGVLADVICGTLVAGQNLIIECPDPNGGVMQFKVDSSGVVLNNGRMYMKSDNGAMGWDAKYGFFAGKSGLFASTDTGYVSPSCVSDEGNLILNKDGFPQDVNVWIGIDGTSYFRGNIYAESGYFNGIVQASDFLDKNGNSMLTSEGKFDSDYLDLMGVNVKNSKGDTVLTIDENGLRFNSAYSPIKYQYSSNNVSWHDDMDASDCYRRESFDGGLTWGTGYQFVGSDADVTRNNIAKAMLDALDGDGLYAEMIDGQYRLLINASAIKAGTLEGINIYGGSYYDLYGKTRLVLNPNNTNSSFADLALYSGDNKAFQIYDNVGSITFYAYGNEFLVSGDLGGTYAIGDWDFSSANVTGITAVFAP